jgi:hypothetical protein
LNRTRRDFERDATMSDLFIERERERGLMGKWAVQCRIGKVYGKYGPI